ncbi:TetR/AcrR family transcriptional regulator [Nocardioides sp.]|uniref:TetR/AcrR family transcriptional regulator n=1 Tax=Nocardioides sp. TaxID=35761 RepID=UPI002717FC45|nr:TetR/AcrR family transcriptional regulator [Nocardioides sp.]MDO9458398.1 helix-turn-helix domain-containing protein [Nocardioides sp.]
MSTSRERMVEAAFALFDEQGYDATTVDQIVDRAGVSRSTFFRAFGAKEDVIFPRHEDLQARIAARLTTGTPQSYRVALREAAGLVLTQYLEEGQLALSRYRLTRTVPALRDREIASMLGYQRLFREHARAWLAELGGPDVDLHAELLAASVVTAHNVVLRRWLRGETDDPWHEFDDAMSSVLTAAPGPQATSGTTVVVLRSGQDLDDVLPALRNALRD